MTTTTIIADGQVTVPKEMLLAPNTQTGGKVDIETMPDDVIRVFPQTLNTSDAAGMLEANVQFTIEGTDEAVAAFRRSSG